MGKTSVKATRRQRETSRQMQRLGGQAVWRRGWIIGVVGIAVLAIVALYLIYQSSPGKHGAVAGGSGFKHVAGQPGAGRAAPTFTLTSGTRGPVSLTDFPGRHGVAD